VSRAKRRFVPIHTSLLSGKFPYTVIIFTLFLVLLHNIIASNSIPQRIEVSSQKQSNQHACRIEQRDIPDKVWFYPLKVIYKRVCVLSSNKTHRVESFYFIARKQTIMLVALWF